MIQPTYAAAKLAADLIQPRLASRPSTPHPAAARIATLPDAATLAILIDAAFWTSLRREEGYVPRVSLAFTSPDQVEHAVTFATSLSLKPSDLTKLAAAVERVGLHLAVWPHDGEPRVWGITRNLPAFCVVLEVILPGLLVVKRSPADESGKFTNLAVLQGDDVKIINSQNALTFPNPLHFANESAADVLLQLAVSIRAHGRGGILLVVPAGSEDWTKSILQPISYSVNPAFSRLTNLLRKDEGVTHSRRWQDALGRAVDGIAGLTAVDGATLIDSDYQLLAFGAKIIRRSGSPQVAQVVVTEPIDGGNPEIAEPAQLGGTRHLSAAQFVQDQRDAVALVASQDGRFTVFSWSPAEEMVRAHRIDALLL